MVKLLAAILLSLVAPGAGQICNGHYLKGIFFGAVFALGLTAAAPLLSRFFRLETERAELRFARAANVAYACAVFISVVDAAFCAWYIYAKSLPEGGHFAAAGVSAAAIVAAHRNLKLPFLVDMLAGRRGFSGIMLGGVKNETVQ